jgi:ATP-dependent Clp protease ATP-binding subunit ClpB
VHFRPEFLNRVDDIVLFKPLTLSEIERVVDLLIEDVTRRLRAQRIELAITEAAREHIAREGFDPVYGARPLRRFIQHEVESRIGRSLLRGEAVPGSMCIVDVTDDELDVRIETSNSKS